MLLDSGISISMTENKLEEVLLIEDDPITNYINNRLIKKVNNDIQVAIAINGKEGLSFIESRKSQNNKKIPQLILLDINMPVMNGFEFLEEFQKFHLSDIVVVMLTTSSHLKDLDKLFRTGNLDLISKPLTEEKFKNIISKYFEDRQGLGKIA